MRSLEKNLCSGQSDNPQRILFELGDEIDAISDISIEIPYALMEQYKIIDGLGNRKRLEKDKTIKINSLEGEYISFAQSSDSTRFYPFDKKYKKVLAFIKKTINEIYRHPNIDTEDSLKLVVCTFPLRISLSKSIIGDFISIRFHSNEPAFLEQLALPFGMYEMLTNETKAKGGIYIFAAENGRGKSTTLGASLLSYSNRHGGLTITIEDPPEMNLHGFIGHNGRCIQTEINKDRSFADAVREAARQFHASGGGTVLIGEIRDAESAKAAIDFANRGVRVLTTIHARTVSEVITNIIGNISAIESSNGKMARVTLAQTLRFVICQELEKHDGKGQWGKRKITGQMLYNPFGEKYDQFFNVLKEEKHKGLNELLSRQDSLLSNAYDDYLDTINSEIEKNPRNTAIIELEEKELNVRKESFNNNFLNKLISV